MLSGRYPSDEFAELRPRVTWDRVGGTLKAREGAKRLAITSGGTIPDRGLYGVFLADAEARTKGGLRVGELDEEMVFELREGDVFLLGATSWRTVEITQDRVLVSPAAGEPGKMPFWHGDRPGRPREFGEAIGALVRRIAGAKRGEAEKILREEHDLDGFAAKNLVDYVHSQVDAASGKSTTLNIIGTLDRPSEGRYLLDGEPVETLDEDALAVLRNRKIGFVFQSFHLLPKLTALANVELPMVYAGVRPRERRDRARAALVRVGLEARADHLPNQLSGGQQQRVAIARAIVNEPLLLLADEPTGALDSTTTRQVMELFGSLHGQGITVVIVTHDPAIAAYAQRVVTFADGRVAA